MIILYHNAVGKRRMQSCILHAYLSSRLKLIMIELVRLPLTVSRRCAIAPEVGNKP